ncbi:MAG: peptidoglycan-associated lipoprotein Pal [Candidatus Pacebacteria bacterium]|nr:peptidoglycan-associated lipoprotein Pal [Candidatus Paceibacterota bacterium]
MRTKLMLLALILPLIVVGCKKPGDTSTMTNSSGMVAAAPAVDSAKMAEPEMANPPKAMADTESIAAAPVASAVVNGTATAACESTSIQSLQEFRETIGDRVFYHYDKANISADGHATLQCQAKWLAKNPAAKVTIEGHADERGTREYNLALGEKRANEAKNYLTSLGVDAGQVTTISYGKERPEVNGSNEAAWQQNRRAVSVPEGLN